MDFLGKKFPCYVVLPLNELKIVHQCSVYATKKNHLHLPAFTEQCFWFSEVMFIKVDRYVSDRNSWGFKWPFGLSWTRYDEYKKYQMCLSTPQTRLKISSFLNLQGKIKRIDCNYIISKSLWNSCYWFPLTITFIRAFGWIDQSGALIKTAYLIIRTFHRFIHTSSANYKDITGHFNKLILQIRRCSNKLIALSHLINIMEFKKHSN